MHGELVGAWTFSRRDIWLQIERHTDAPADIFLELYPELVLSLMRKPRFRFLAERSNDPAAARMAFMRVQARSFKGERAVIDFFERAYKVFVEYGDLAETYFHLTRSFMSNFNLRYDLQRPYRLCPTLPGIFDGLVRELKVVIDRDPHLASMLSDFEHALGDLTIGVTESRIKTCIQKQMNLLEAIGRMHPAVVSANTLGAIANQVGTWPHDNVKEAMTKLYGFASDYPGIRHGGTASSAKRAIQMRDMVAVSVLMAGFAPYLTEGVDVERAYRGSA